MASVIVTIATFVTRLQVIALDCDYRAIGEIGKGPPTDSTVLFMVMATAFSFVFARLRLETGSV